MFNPEEALNNSESTNLALCIFPHLKEFAVIDLTESNNDNPIKIINCNEILDEKFFSIIENEFKKMLKDNEFPFLNLIGLPQNIENLIRSHTLTSILDILKSSNNEINYMNNIAVLFFSGRILETTKDELEKILINLFDEGIEFNKINNSVDKIIELMKSEKTAQKTLIKNDLYDIITGNNESYGTLWQRSNN
tara:strand:- start:1436 stop:2014 length:579 start_codon:yes stop_codon:yes gene_type:complete